MIVSHKMLLVLAILAAGLAVATILLYAPGGPKAVDYGPESLLIQGLDPEAIHTIVIETAADRVTLTRTAGGYAVAERSGRPADSKAVREMLIRCLDIRYQRKTTEDSDRHADYGVEAPAGTEDKPSSDTTVVRLLGKDKEELVVVVIGKSDQRGGSYVRRTDDDTVYVTKAVVSFNAQPITYIDQSILDIPADDVQSVTVTSADGPYTIARDEAGKPKLDSVPEGKQAKETELSAVLGALNYLQFDEVSRAADPQTTWSHTFTARTADHTTYVIQYAKSGTKHLIRVRAEGPPQEMIDKVNRAIEAYQRTGTVAPKAEQEENNRILGALESAETFTQTHAGWVYELPSWKADNLHTPLAELLEDIPEPETQPATQPAVPETQPATPATQPATPETRPAVPETRPAAPSTRPAPE